MDGEIKSKTSEMFACENMIIWRMDYMETEMKIFKLYKEYRKIPFNRIKNMEKYVTEKLKKGHAIIQILVNEDRNSIDELISYANASEEESWYRCYVEPKQHLKDYVILQYLVPYYEEEPDMKYVSIYDDHQNVITFDSATNDIVDMKNYYVGNTFQWENDKTNYHFEFYISKGKCDIENFGASMECHFADAWHNEYGWIKEEK